jgi:predicted RNA binding protein YcfA (HicA-like mRNA interferase family)
MSIIPVLAAREVVQRLVRAGFVWKKAKGNHQYYWHPGSRRITCVPVHGSRDVGRKLLLKILEQADLSLEEFLKL